MLTVSSQFDGGNIRVVDCTKADDIRLEINPEPYTPVDKVAHFQWFHFRVSGARGQALTLRIVNAAKSSFPEAWPGYSACASYDYSTWFRVPTTYDKEAGVLSFTVICEQDSIYFAYWAPYPYTRHQGLVAGLQAQHPELVRLEVLGQTLEGRDIDLLQIARAAGAPGAGKKVVWMIARQHPGESMAEFFVEGLLQRLVDPHDALSLHALKRAVFYVVPNMCPDGAVRGHLRTNAAGANLNREWDNARADYSPEVYYVLRKMEETGCDAFYDVHGDEEVAWNFLAGEEGIPSFSAEEAREQDVFQKALMAVSPDYRPVNLYGVDPPGKANLAEANNYVGEHFKCFSVTLEQPFKDVDSHPDTVHGWSPERAMRFGATCLHAMYAVLVSMEDKAGGKEGAVGAGGGGAGGKRGAAEAAAAEADGGGKRAKGT